MLRAGGAKQTHSSAPLAIVSCYLEIDSFVHVGSINIFQSSLQVLHFYLQKNESPVVVD